MVLEVTDEELTSTPTLVTSGNRRGGRFMYYRQPNGHIASGETHENQQQRYIRAGWQPLPKYGQFLWNEWSNQRPLDHLFLRGGAKELPYDQLIEEGWAWLDGKYIVRPCTFSINNRPCCTNEPLRVTFPQLAGRVLPAIVPCQYCTRTGTEKQISDHIDVSHAKDMAPMKVAQMIGESFGKATQKEAPSSSFAYVCGKCNAGFSSHMPLARHVKEHNNDS